MKKPVDIGDYNSPGAAAKAVYKRLCEEVKASGMNPDMEVGLLTPEESERFCGDRAWRVTFEAGDHEWAIAASLGSPRHGVVCYSGKGKVWAEPYYSLDLGFYN